MDFSRKTIALFGGTGFIGRHTVPLLAKTGAQILIATRSPASAYFLKPCGDVGQIVPISCDVQDSASVMRVMARATHAVNLVGILHEQGRKNTFDRLHHLAAQRIAHAAAETGTRGLIHISALGASKGAAAHYARSKAAGEDAVLRAYPQAVILRPSLVFGPEDRFFNRFAAMARTSPVIPLVMGGRTRFQPVYVGDVAAAILNLVTAATPQKNAGRIFELVGPDTASFRTLIEKIFLLTGRTRFLLPLPAAAAKCIGAVAGLLPSPPLTLDQVRSLAADNVASGHHPGLEALGVQPTAMDSVLPAYLRQYGTPVSDFLSL